MKRNFIIFICMIFFGILSECGHWRKRYGIWTYSEHRGSQNKPAGSYPKNNNRIDSHTHIQINQPIYQPRKHTHNPRENNRRNQ
jgi:hypothetical protein